VTHPRPALILPLLAQAAILACYPPPATPSPASGAESSASMDTLPAGTELRLIAHGNDLRGRIVAVRPDSLRPHRGRSDTTLLRADIDSAWTRQPRRYAGTKTGLGIGLVVAGLLVVTPHGADGSYYGWLVASRVALLGLGVGITADVLTPARWVPIQPRGVTP